MFGCAPTTKSQHGGNMTCTIMMHLLALGVFDGKETVLIQWDGASDNTCFTNIYFFVWLLLAAQECGAPLKTVQISRFLVGLVLCVFFLFLWRAISNRSS